MRDYAHETTTKREGERMNISVKSIGYKVGTSGWLASGLRDGSITIQERARKLDGRPMLVLLSGENRVVLARWNPYGLDNGTLDESETYQVLHVGSADDPGAMTDTIGLTPAAAAALRTAAQGWCDQINGARASDNTCMIEIVRVNN